MRANNRFIAILCLLSVAFLFNPKCQGFGKEIFDRGKEMLLKHLLDCLTLASVSSAPNSNDFFQVEKRFTYDYTDSLNKVTRELICSEMENNPFYPIDGKSDGIKYVEPTDSVSADGNPSYTTEIYRWLVYLTAVSKTAFCSGYGQTIQGGDNYNVPLNFTQSLAALDWYDLNKSIVDPRLFFYFQGNRFKNGPYSGSLSYDNIINFVWDISADINIDIPDIKKFNLLDSLSDHRIDSVISVADSIFRHIRDNMISIEPLFKLNHPEDTIIKNKIFSESYRSPIRFMRHRDMFQGCYWLIDEKWDSLGYFYNGQR